MIMRNKLLIVFIFAVLSIVLISCGRGHRSNTTTSATQNTNTDTTSLPENPSIPKFIPFPAMPEGVYPKSPVRHVSDNSYLVDGISFIASVGELNGNNISGSQSYQIISDKDNELAYVQYNVEKLTSSRPVKIDFKLDPYKPVGEDEPLPLNYYIGIANYTKFAWEWKGPYTDNDPTSFSILLNSKVLYDRYVDNIGTLHYVVITSIKDSPKLSEKGQVGLSIISSTTTISPSYEPNNPHYVPIKSLYSGKKNIPTFSIDSFTETSSVQNLNAFVNPVEPVRASSALTSDQYITIEWDHVAAFNTTDKQNEASKYQIFRKGRNDKDFILIGEANAPRTSYQDPVDNFVKTPAIPDPVPGEIYQYCINAVTSKDLFCPKSSPNSVIPKILIPKGIKATIGLETEISLTWDETTGAVEYEIWASDMPKDPNIKLLDTMTAPPITGAPVKYSDKVSPKGKLRYYRVKAIGLEKAFQDAKSTFSSEVYGVLGEVLFPPTDVAASDGTSNKAITITWKAPIEGSIPEGYSIWRSNSETGEYSKVGDVGNVLTYDDPVPTNDTYWYNVKATKAGVEDSIFASKADSGIKKQLVMPPDNLKATKGDFDNKITLTWEAPSSGLVPDKYLIFRSIKQDSDFIQIKEVVGLLTYDDIAVPDGSTYWYKVKSQNGGDISGFSTEDFGYLTQLLPPQNLTATDNKYLDKVKIDWLAPASGAKPDGYLIYRSDKSDSGFVEIANVVQPNLTYDDTLVPDGFVYYYKAVSYKATYTNSVDTNVDSGYVTQLTPPENVIASNGDFTNKVVVTWSHTSVQKPDGYSIYRASSEFGTYEKVGNVGYLTTFEDTSVLNGFSQWYKVIATKKSFPDSLFSEADEGYLTQLAPPTSLQATNETYSDKIQLTWSHPSGITPDGYDVYRSTSQNGTYIKIKSIGYVTSYDDNTVTDLYTYWYKLKSIKFNFNDSGYCTEDSGAYAQLNPPTNVSASDATYSNKIVITWSHPTGQTPEGYDIYRYSLQSGIYSKITSVGYVTTYSDTTTPEVGVYWYKLKATTTKFGDSIFSNDDSGSNEILSNWWLFGQSPTHTRRSTTIGPSSNTVKWSYKTSNLVRSSASIAADGTVYVGSSDNSLYAFNSDGSYKWSYTTGIVNYSSPAIGADGTIYVGTSKLYAIKPDGKLKWSYTPGGSLNYSSPAIGADGTIYIGCVDKKLYAIDSTGSLKWTYPTAGDVRSTPAISPDGTIYFGSYDKNLYALNPNGSLKWSYPTGDQIWSSPAIGADGTIYVGSYDNKLHAVNPSGTNKWTYKTGGWVTSSPAIDADGNIYVGSWDNKLHAINPDGSFKWSYKTGSIVHSSPAIGADGTIYVGSQDKYLVALNPNGSLKWSYLAGNYILSSPSVGPDGTVYFGSDDYKFYAIGPGAGKTGLYPPSNITATDGTYADKVRITWTAPDWGAAPVGYYVYRSQSNSVSAIYQYIGYSTTTAYEDTTASIGTTYYYKIQSYNFTTGYNDSIFSAWDAGNR